MDRNEAFIIDNYLLNSKLEYLKPNLHFEKRIDKGIQKNQPNDMDNTFREQLKLDLTLNEIGNQEVTNEEILDDNLENKSTEIINKKDKREKLNTKQTEYTHLFDLSNLNTKHNEYKSEIHSPRHPHQIPNYKNNKDQSLPIIIQSKSQSQSQYPIKQVNQNKERNQSVYKPTKSFNYPNIFLKIYIIYKRIDYPIHITAKTRVKELRNIISSLVNLPKEKMELMHKDLDLMNNTMDNYLIYDLLLNTSYPFFEVKKKLSLSLSTNVCDSLHPMMHNHKILVNNISFNDLYKQINIFFKNSLLEKDFFIETLDTYSFSIGFSFLSVAFDFKRYLFILKANDMSFQNITVRVKFDPIISYNDLNKVNVINPFSNRNSKRNKYRDARIKFSNRISADVSFEKMKTKIIKQNNLPLIHETGICDNKKYNNNRSLLQCN